MHSELHYPMFDLTNTQPMVVDTSKPVVESFPLKVAAITCLKPSPHTCEHATRIPAANNQHWNCANCGVFISNVLPLCRV